MILLFQIYYYRIYDDRSTTNTYVESPTSPPDTLVPSSPLIQSEQTPLLLQSQAQAIKTTLSALDPEASTGVTSNWLYRSTQYIGGLMFVTLAGLAAWWVTGRQGASGNGDDGVEVFDWTSQTLGWASAVMYSMSHLRTSSRKVNVFFFFLFSRLAYPPNRYASCWPNVLRL